MVLGPIFTKDTRNEKLAAGLGAGLQDLINHKMGQMQQEKQLSQGASLWEQLGANPQQARVLASQPQQIQEPILKQLLQRGGVFQGQPGSSESQASGQGGGSLADLFKGQYENPHDRNARLAREQAERIEKGKAKDRALARTQEAKKFEETKRANAIKEANKEEEIALQTQGDQLKEIEKRGKLAPQQIANYEDIIKLSKSGQLHNKGARPFLKKAGLEGIFDNPATDAFKNIVNAEVFDSMQAAGVKNFSNEDRQQFETTFPNLFQTNQGIEFAAKNKLRTAEVNKAENDIRAKIFKKNGNRVKRGMLDEIEVEMAPIRDKYAQQTREDLTALLIKTNPKNFKYGATESKLRDPSTFSGTKKFIDDDGKVTIVQGTKPL